MRTLINFFFPSVTSVMASFQKTIDDLNRVAVKRRAKADKHDDKIIKLMEKADLHSEKATAAEAEADAADALASKLSESFGLN